MADSTQIPSLNPLVNKGDTEAFREYVNLQADMEKSIKRQNNSLFEQLGIRKDLSFSIRDYFMKVQNLNKYIEEAKNHEKDLEKELETIVNETQRRNQIQIIKSIKQRREAYASELEMMTKVETLGLLPIIWGLSKAYKVFLSLDKAAWEFRQTLGLTRASAHELRKIVESVAIEYMDVGVTAKSAGEAMIALGKEMGSIRTVSRDLVKTTAILKSQLGVSEEDSATFFKNMAAVAHSTMQAQENMAYIVTDLSQAAGVPLPMIMKDLATKSNTTLLMMSRLPNQVARAAVELRKMGTSLDQAAKSSREILNFSDNINAEMEASVLLGKAVNLQHARELSYRRDLEGSTKEILRITKEIDFSNFDVFQQEAFARATGKSAEELLTMVQAEKQWNAAKRDPNLAKRVAAYEQMRAANQETAKASAKNLRLMIEQRSNQERLTAISQKWNQIITQLAYKFLPIIDYTLAAVPAIIEVGSLIARLSVNLYGLFLTMKNMSGVFEKISLNALTLANILKPIRSLLSGISRIFGHMSVATSGIANFATRIGVAFSRVGQVFAPVIEFFKIFGKLTESFKWIAPLFKTLGKFTGVLNVVFAVWNVIKSIISGIKDIANGNIWSGIRKIILGSLVGIVEGVFGFIIDIPTLILQGLSSILPSLFGWAEGLNDKWHAILKDWFGFSPSKVGLSIVKGIVSVGPMLFDALTSPFRNGLAWVMDKLPGMGKVAEKLRGGMSELINKPIEARISSNVPSVITPTGLKVANDVTATTPAIIDNKDKSEKSSDDLLVNILNAINTLNKNLENGKIGFYVDGQLLSATLSRQTDFRNGFGVNKARA